MAEVDKEAKVILKGMSYIELEVYNIASSSSSFLRLKL